jgi:uncharacterized protein YjbI with pentapeptide repeats
MAGPDTKNIDASPEPIPGKETLAPQADTKELDALLDSLNGSAERFQTLWFSFLGLTLYLAIAALATTHRNLLLGEPQTLPILNIKVELLPFYIIAPLLYLVFHFYLLMMLALLACTAAEFDKLLRTTLADEADRERYRARVGNALFLQLLVGMKGERSGVNAVLLGLIALITIVLAPLATLVLMQMMFLPYHEFRITWWHRGIVVADLVLIVVMTVRCFYPRGLGKAPLVLGAINRKPRWATAMAFCVLLAVALAPLAYWLSFRQGRWAGEPRPSSFKEWRQWMAGDPPRSPEVNPDYAATAKGAVFGWFPNRLQLRDETIVGGTKLEETKKEIASRGGDFVPTKVFDGRDLQAADLSGADLRGVSLNDAAMQGSDLSRVRLDGARLIRVNLQGAELGGARLRSAGLAGAELRGAELQDAQLQGANLVAQLQGADLSGAQLQGAYLGGAQLQGADLSGAQLQGASLGGARLQGANLSGAQLQGAGLRGAGLQGANLLAAQLQGADLGYADLSDGELDMAFVFRTDISDAELATAAIRNIQADKVMPWILPKTAPLTDEDVDRWTGAATEFAREKDKAEITQRFARLKPVQVTGQDASDQAKWSELGKQSAALDPDGGQYRRWLADRLGHLACDPDGAPYVARGLVGQPPFYSRLASLGDQLERVRERMKAGREKPDACKGVAGFTEADWRQLDAIKPSQSQKASQATPPAP